MNCCPECGEETGESQVVLSENKIKVFIFCRVCSWEESSYEGVWDGD